MVTDFYAVALLTRATQIATTSGYAWLPMPVSPPTWWMPLFWGVTGVSFCAIEWVVRKYFGHKYQAIALIMGITALIMGAIVWHLMMVVELNWQIAYWVGLSLVSVLWLRPIFVKSRGAIAVPDATEAKTLSPILPGEVGRVLYEGSSWPAQCDVRDLAIAANQKVYVLRCEGNTLIVVPDQLFHS